MKDSYTTPTGRYVESSSAGEAVRAFIPNPLPPADLPALSYQEIDLLANANRALGRLDGISDLLPDPSLFIYFYVRKEAVLSSQIEGTQSSLSELLQFEENALSGVALDDVEEVSRYVAALNHGLKRTREDGFPVSVRLLREIHEVLLGSGRGSEKEPGELRRSQNWIGGTRPGNAIYVPPPADHVPGLMGDLEKFLHGSTHHLPLLIKAALAHVQFETIHPFLDGNGRLGRLLITLLFTTEGAIREPLLYLSLYLKEKREEYYDLLQRVRREGAWSEWIRFFIEGVRETAGEATATARAIVDLTAKDKARISSLGRAASSALKVHDCLVRRPISQVGPVATAAGLSNPTAQSALRALEGLGVVREVTGKERGRAYGYTAYLKVLESGG